MLGFFRDTLLFVAGLFLLWLALSAHFTGLFLGLGLGSCILVLWLSRRMRLNDREGFPLHLGSAFVLYAGWLVKEVFFSNIQVARIILHPKLPISPTLFISPAGQKTDLGRVVFANSITLTPGTISIDILGQGDNILVHALSNSMSWDEAGCEMDTRVCALGA